MSSTRTFRRPNAPARRTFADEPDAPTAPKEIGPTIGPDGKRDWSRYNATVVGNNPVPGVPLHPRELPGVAEARARGLAAQAEWLATRKTYCYKNEDEGWQRVRGKQPRKKNLKLAAAEEE